MMDMIGGGIFERKNQVYFTLTLFVFMIVATGLVSAHFYWTGQFACDPALRTKERDQMMNSIDISAFVFLILTAIVLFMQTYLE
jgi:hypothetical protein